MFARIKLFIVVVTLVAGCGPEPTTGAYPGAAEGKSERAEETTAAIAAGMTFTAIRDITPAEGEEQIELWCGDVGGCVIDLRSTADHMIAEGGVLDVIQAQEIEVHHRECPELADMCSDYYTSTTQIALERGVNIACHGLRTIETSTYIDYEHYYLDAEQIQFLLQNYFVVE